MNMKDLKINQKIINNNFSKKKSIINMDFFIFLINLINHYYFLMTLFIYFIFIFY